LTFHKLSPIDRKMNTDSVWLPGCYTVFTEMTTTKVSYDDHTKL